MTNTIDYFVIASPKSGTTWVQRLLCSHPDVHCTETRLYGRYFDPRVGASLHLPLEQYVRFMSSYHHPTDDVGSGESYADRLLDQLVGTIARFAKSESGKSLYGEKVTPYKGTGAHVLGQIRARHSDAKLIHLVRDPRDVIVSGMAHWKRALASHPSDEPHRYNDEDLLFADLLEHWIEVQRAMLDAGERVRTIRYEDLTCDPQGTVRDIFQHIGADDSDALISRCVEENRFEKLTGGRSPGQVDNESFYRRGIAGGWVDELNDERAHQIESQASDLVSRFGFTPSPARAP